MLVLLLVEVCVLKKQANKKPNTTVFHLRILIELSLRVALNFKAAVVSEHAPNQPLEISSHSAMRASTTHTPTL